MKEVSSKVTNKEVSSNLHIRAVTSDGFDENIVTLLKEPWFLIHKHNSFALIETGQNQR